MAPNQKTNAFCLACLACLAVARGSKVRLRPRGFGKTAFAALRARRLVGLGRLELPTSRLSSARSNQLSYKPLTTISLKKDRGLARAQLACAR